MSMPIAMTPPEEDDLLREPGTESPGAEIQDRMDAINISEPPPPPPPSVPYRIPRINSTSRSEAEGSTEMEEQAILAVRQVVAKRGQVKAKISGLNREVAADLKHQSEKLVAYGETMKDLGDEFFTLMKECRRLRVISQEDYTKEKTWFYEMRRVLPPSTSAGSWRGGQQGRNYNRHRPY